MIYYKTDTEVEAVRKAALLVSHTLAEVAKMLKPGMTTLDIDHFCNTYIRDHGALPSFYQYRGFPYNICASVNDVVVHGFPNKKLILDDDIVSIDLGVILNGWHGDHGYSFVMHKASNDVLLLAKRTKESLYKGIEQAVSGNKIGDIGYAIQQATEKKYGYGVVTDLVGHGLGRSLHEDPQVPNYGKKGTGVLLQDNLILAIEPMINMGTAKITMDKDGWTIRTKDKKPSAHFEHDVCVKKNKPWILSDFSVIEQAEKANPFLLEI
ncbi:MAG: type I methionyl aminopeptidase [Phycisphaerales bacterium]|nr:type I methionyl aminopeptidase [Phycisphaerales bacterium]